MKDPKGPASGRGVTRRDALKYGGALTAAGALTQLDRSSPLTEELLAALRGSGNLTATLLRPDDFLSLEFDFLNLKLLGPGQAGPGDTSAARLVRIVAGRPAYVIVGFEPQSIGEETFWEASKTDASDNADVSQPSESGNESLPALPVKARIASPSRLAFKVPDSIDAVPFNDASLLAWERFQARVVPAALPPGSNPRKTPVLREPNLGETSIELPRFLFLSPHKDSAWAHALDPVTHGGRTELWHTRLGVRKLVEGKPAVDEADDALRTVRAVWSTGFSKNNPPDHDNLGPFRMPLTPRDRWELVRLSSDFSFNKYTPLPVNVDRLMLTTLGAWINSRGDWSNPPDIFNILHWTERGTMGREHYVRVVKRGFLFPFGHRAALIQISERKIQKVAESGPQKGDHAAFLRKRAFIVIKEPEKSFGDRDMPLQKVRLRTVITPDLDKYDGAGVGNNHPTAVKKANGTKYGEAAFWPRVGGEDFLFNILATDVDGQEVELSTPLIFVLHSTAVNSGHAENICNRYEEAGNAARRERALQGQRVAYAPASAAKPGDTSFETESFTLGCKELGSGKPRFTARMMEADVRLSAVEAIKGPLATAAIQHHPVYLTHGLAHANNKTESFLKLKEAVGLDYGTGNTGDRCGGLGAPNMAITGLSRTLGPTGGPPDVAPPNFNPADFLQGAKFLGINFADVLIAGLDFLSQAANVPKTVSETVYEAANPNKIPKEIRTTLDWVPKLKPDPLGLFDPDDGPDGPASMKLQALFVTPINPPGEPDFEVVGDLRSFKLHLFGKGGAFMILPFNYLTIRARKGQKPEVDLDIQDVEFAGPLSFVETLKELMSSSGNGFDLDLSPTRVAASVTIGLPTTSVGVFTLANIAFTFGVTIPFTGQPVTSRFAFCSREQPFLLTYTIFGGGGFFEISAGAHGIEGFKAALEFGAAAAIDLGVASGEVQIMAGTYFEMAEDDAELTGYFRLNGSLDILGLIHASLEFYLGMTYDIPADELWGQCTLTIEVEVLFFSATVEASAEKKIAGGGGGGGAAAASANEAKALAARGGGAAVAASATGPDPIQLEELMTESEWQNEFVPAFASGAF